MSCIFIKSVHIASMGFDPTTANLYCYKVFLKTGNLTTDFHTSTSCIKKNLKKTYQTYCEKSRGTLRHS